MRLRSWVVAMTALLTATMAMADNGYPPRTGGDYSGPRWYGYFWNNSFVANNADHTNITMIGAVERNAQDDATQQSAATTAIENALKVAQKDGEQAMVDIEAIVFIETGDPSNTCYGNNPTAKDDFDKFVATLETDGYLVRNHPELGTVSSFYVADEPDRSCGGSLRDVYSDDYTDMGPAPALLNAISAIRQNADAGNFPLATIVTKNGYSYMLDGLGLFDWISFDDYGSGYGTYLDTLAGFEVITHDNDLVGGTPQHYFMVPAVSWGLGDGHAYVGGAPSFYDRFIADDSIVGIMPFKWAVATDTNGMNYTSSWAPEYIALGHSVMTGTPVAQAEDIPSVEITVIASSAILQ